MRAEEEKEGSPSSPQPTAAVAAEEAAYIGTARPRAQEQRSAASIAAQLPLFAPATVAAAEASRPRQQQKPANDCSGCGQTISDRYVLHALGRRWHEDCLRCSCCDCHLGEVGSTLFLKADLTLCKKDYFRLFGATGRCSACSKSISATEMVMRAKEHVYHLECFACRQCGHRFCVGDRYYLCGSSILCEADYEEAVVQAVGQRCSSFSDTFDAYSGTNHPAKS